MMDITAGLDATAWVGLSFVTFVFLLVFLGVPRKIASALDTQRDEIKKRLDEAASLRLEAEKLLGQAEKRLEMVQQEATQIVAQARMQAEAITQQAQKDLEMLVQRRTQALEQRIRQAELKAEEEARERIATTTLKVVEAAVKPVLTPDYQATYAQRVSSELAAVSL